MSKILFGQLSIGGWFSSEYWIIDEIVESCPVLLESLGH